MSAVLSHNDPTAAFEYWQPVQFDKAEAPEVDSADKARREGFLAGMKEGRERVNAQAARLRAIVEQMQGEYAVLDEMLAERILDLALATARQFLQGALGVNPRHVLSVVRQSLRELALTGEERRILLHPEDARLVRESLADLPSGGGWKVVDDPAVSRGGCRLLTGHGETDATVETRWRLIVASLGRDDSWLDREEQGE